MGRIYLRVIVEKLDDEACPLSEAADELAANLEGEEVAGWAVVEATPCPSPKTARSRAAKNRKEAEFYIGRAIHDVRWLEKSGRSMADLQDPTSPAPKTFGRLEEERLWAIADLLGLEPCDGFRPVKRRRPDGTFDLDD